MLLNKKICVKPFSLKISKIVRPVNLTNLPNGVLQMGHCKEVDPRAKANTKVLNFGSSSIMIIRIGPIFVQHNNDLNC